MKIIIVDDIWEHMKKDNQYIHDVAAGKVKLKKCEKTIVCTPQTFHEVLSPQRIRILIHINTNPGLNITEIAKSLGRRFEAVHRDIKFLISYDLIKTRKEKKSRIPYFYEKIELPALGVVV